MDVLEPLKAVEFFVPGTPKTAGSKRAINLPGKKFPVIIDDANNKAWRRAVKLAGTAAWKGAPSPYPIKVIFTFKLKRPKAAYNTKGQVKQGQPVHHTTKPDVLKLARCIEDALTGITWMDDAQIDAEFLFKKYQDDKEGVLIRIEERHPSLTPAPPKVGIVQMSLNTGEPAA